MTDQRMNNSSPTDAKPTEAAAEPSVPAATTLEQLGTHPLGVAAGAIGGAMTGVVVGLAAGPVGSLAGAIGGAVAGALLGSGSVGQTPLTGPSVSSPVTETTDEVTPENS